MIMQKHFMEVPPSAKSGYITLISVLIAGAIAVAVATTLIVLGIIGAQTSFTLEQSYQAKALMSACAEEALQEIRDSTPFTGSGSLTLGAGTCVYNVVNTGGSNRTITATGTVGDVVRKARITLEAVNPRMKVISWQEVADL
jgi:hypothetical protein